MSQKPKVLVFIDWFLPAFRAGGPIRSCANVIEALKDDIDFFVLTSAYDYQMNEVLENVNLNQWTFHNDINVKYISNKKYKHIVNAFKEKTWDAVWINGIWSPFFSLLPMQLSRFYAVKTIVSSRGMFAPEAIAYKFKRKKATLSILNGFGTFKNCFWHFTNEAEKKQAQQFVKLKNTQIIPNIAAPISNVKTQSNKNKGSLKLLYLGRISQEKNTLFALEILAQLNVAVTLHILGQANDSAYEESCRKLAKSMEQHRIEFLGAAPHHEVLKRMHQYDFLFLPSKGENFGHAIAEALKSALPLIISDQTPWRNLQSNKCGYDLPLEAAAFARVLEHCYAMDAVEHAKMKQAALQFAQQQFSDAAAIRQYFTLFAN